MLKAYERFIDHPSFICPLVLHFFHCNTTSALQIAAERNGGVPSWETVSLDVNDRQTIKGIPKHNHEDRCVCYQIPTGLKNKL